MRQDFIMQLEGCSPFTSIYRMINKNDFLDRNIIVFIDFIIWFLRNDHFSKDVSPLEIFIKLSKKTGQDIIIIWANSMLL